VQHSSLAFVVGICLRQLSSDLRSYASLKSTFTGLFCWSLLQVSFAEYRLYYRALLQKRPIISSSLLIVATPYQCNICRRHLSSAFIFGICLQICAHVPLETALVLFSLIMYWSFSYVSFVVGICLWLLSSDIISRFALICLLT